MAAGDLATQGARASAAIILTLFAENILMSTANGLSLHLTILHYKLSYEHWHIDMVMCLIQQTNLLSS